MITIKNYSGGRGAVIAALGAAARSLRLMHPNPGQELLVRYRDRLGSGQEEQYQAAVQDIPAVAEATTQA